MRLGDTEAFVSSTDPAVDHKESRLDKFYTTRDQEHLVIKEGAQPTVYHLRRVPRSLVTKWIQSATTMNESYVRAFECALVKVENLVDDTGKVIPVWEPKWVTNKDTTPVLTNEELDLFHPDDVFEIGHLAWERCFLRPGSDPSYPVPPLYHVRLERARRLPVEEILKELDQSSEESATA